MPRFCKERPHRWCSGLSAVPQEAPRFYRACEPRVRCRHRQKCTYAFPMLDTRVCKISHCQAWVLRALLVIPVPKSLPANAKQAVNGALSHKLPSSVYGGCPRVCRALYLISRVLSLPNFRKLLRQHLKESYIIIISRTPGPPPFQALLSSQKPFHV